MVLQVNINQLRELQSEPDSQGLSEVGHRPDQAVIVVKEVIIQPLGVRVTLHTLDEMIGYDFVSFTINDYVDTGWLASKEIWATKHAHLSFVRLIMIP